jgi:hypothetical protein
MENLRQNCKQQVFAFLTLQLFRYVPCFKEKCLPSLYDERMQQTVKTDWSGSEWLSLRLAIHFHVLVNYWQAATSFNTRECDMLCRFPFLHNACA